MAYQPDPRAADRLATMTQKLADATSIPNDFDPAPQFLGQLASGELLFDSVLELDTDGWPEGKDAGDDDWQPDTSLRLADRSSLNANRVPYFVLPLPPSWPRQFGIDLGDYAAVVFRDRVAFAVFGDRGPPSKIGEGSIELLRRLGAERLRPNGTVINAGMGPRVLTIVFPSSGASANRIDEATLLQSIEETGSRLFVALGGNL